jgi:hypothetical protein
VSTELLDRYRKARANILLINRFVDWLSMEREIDIDFPESPEKTILEFFDIDLAQLQEERECILGQGEDV